MSDFLPVDLMVEFKLKGREDALQCLIKVNISEEWSAESSVHDLMNIAAQMVLEEIDTVGTHRLVFTDSRHSKHIILMDEIQAVLIHAPDKLPTD